jgi:hypothetical protein
MATTLFVEYYNSFWLKKVIYRGTLVDPSNPSTSQPWPYPATSNIGGEDPYRGGYGSTFPGLPWNPTGYPTFPSGAADSEVYNYQEVENWVLEESRIKGGYNNVSTDYGAKAYLKEETNAQEYRPNAIIYSGLYNSRTGINQTNVFSVGEAITKAVDPQKGSIQRLYAEDTNLIVFQEDKVNRALIDKDAIYSAEGNASITSTNLVIGQITPYVGEFGISKNPESFAVYGYRKYFADRDRGSIMRLSRDGLTEISEYGMSNFFRDMLRDLDEDFKPIYLTGFEYSNKSVTPPAIILSTTSNGQIQSGSMVLYLDPINLTYANASNSGDPIYVKVDTGDATNVGKVYTTIEPRGPNGTEQLVFKTFDKDKIVGGWDTYDRFYTVSMQDPIVGIAPTKAGGNNEEGFNQTVVFDESVLGWTSRYSYVPEFIFSIKNDYFTVKTGQIWKHNNETSNTRNVFYGETSTPSAIELVFNNNVSTNKNYLTVGYEGSNGWQVDSFVSDLQRTFEVPNDFSDANTTPQDYQNQEDKTAQVLSYYEGAYDDIGNVYPAVLSQPIRRAGFVRKEGKYVAELKSNSDPRPGEVVFGPDSYGGYPSSGIKGYFATVIISTDNATDFAGEKTIFSTFSNNVVSST